MGGETLAVDLADTVLVAPAQPHDLLGDEDSCERFWNLQSSRLPVAWRAPGLRATRQLRDAVRGVLDAVAAGADPSPAHIETLNRASAAAPASLELDVDGQRELRTRWHGEGPRLALAAVANSALQLLADPALDQRLRQCANPECSMLFVTGDRRRVWCTPNICGNRARVARHYRRHRD